LETVNHLLRKTSFDAAKETLEMFIRSPRITTIHNDENAFRQTSDFFAKYPGLSVTDVNIVLHMLRLKERNLFSFDKGFDIVKELSRRVSS
jgi:predicted nucleic acid-binding protein